MSNHESNGVEHVRRICVVVLGARISWHDVEIQCVEDDRFGDGARKSGLSNDKRDTVVRQNCMLGRKVTDAKR